jgi:hypothetical protein
VRRRVDRKRSLEKRGFGRSVIGRAQALRESVRKAFNARRSGVYGSRKILFILAHIIEGSHLLISGDRQLLFQPCDFTFQFRQLICCHDAGHHSQALITDLTEGGFELANPAIEPRSQSFEALLFAIITRHPEGLAIDGYANLSQTASASVGIQNAADRFHGGYQPTRNIFVGFFKPGRACFTFVQRGSQLRPVLPHTLQIVLKGIERTVCIQTALDGSLQLAEGGFKALYGIGQARLFHDIDFRHIKRHLNPSWSGFCRFVLCLTLSVAFRIKKAASANNQRVSRFSWQPDKSKKVNPAPAAEIRCTIFFPSMAPLLVSSIR